MMKTRKISQELNSTVQFRKASHNGQNPISPLMLISLQIQIHKVNNVTIHKLTWGHHSLGNTSKKVKELDYYQLKNLFPSAYLMQDNEGEIVRS